MKTQTSNSSSARTRNVSNKFDHHRIQITGHFGSKRTIEIRSNRLEPDSQKRVQFSSGVSIKLEKEPTQIADQFQMIAADLGTDLVVMLGKEYEMLLDVASLKRRIGKIMLTDKEVALLLHTTEGALRKKRASGSKSMPPYIKFGRNILYDSEDVFAFLEKKKSS